MNLKDNLMKRLFLALLYKKIVVWMDLNIQSDDFVHSKVVEVMQHIDAMKESLHYVPSKLQFEEVTLETPGLYSYEEAGDPNASSETLMNLQALTEAFVDMENIVKKNFKLSAEKKAKFTDNNPVQMTLREELERVY